MGRRRHGEGEKDPLEKNGRVVSLLIMIWLTLSSSFLNLLFSKLQWRGYFSRKRRYFWWKVSIEETDWKIQSISLSNGCNTKNDYMRKPSKRRARRKVCLSESKKEQSDAAASTNKCQIRKVQYHCYCVFSHYPFNTLAYMIWKDCHLPNATLPTQKGSLFVTQINLLLLANIQLIYKIENEILRFTRSYKNGPANLLVRKF